jgi:hypothetical protein
VFSRNVENTSTANCKKIRDRVAFALELNGEKRKCGLEISIQVLVADFTPALVVECTLASTAALTQVSVAECTLVSAVACTLALAEDSIAASGAVCILVLAEDSTQVLVEVCIQALAEDFTLG